MKEEILINVTSRETRAARLQDGVLQEIYIDRASRRGLVSSIYKGRVSRVLPGMQAAFIDIGLERTAFLHASDIAQPELQGSGPVALRTENIRDLIVEGGEVLVQVLKDPLGTKGARLTTYITVPSRFLVFMPKGQGVGVSTRIEEEEERQRLRAIVDEMLSDSEAGGWIVRTAAEGATPEAIRADMLFLRRLWGVIGEKALRAKPGRLVYADLPLPLRILRDVLGDDVERIQVDDEATYNTMREFIDVFMPQIAAIVELYTGKRPIFDLYNVEDELQKALDRKAPLKSGGYLIIDQTEAMTTVDVNTGAYVGFRNLEETIYKTNLEAAKAIARQIRLRNLGGMIILDFIDMIDEEHRRQVLQVLEKYLSGDPAKTHICDVSALGLVEMTRKRTRESLEHLLCAACPTCEGRGSVKTAETVCYEIFREIVRQSREFDFQEFMILAHQDVIELLLDEESGGLAELETQTGKPIRLQTEALYNQDQFDVVLM